MTKSATASTETPAVADASGAADAPPVHGYVPAFDTADGNEDPSPPAVTHSTVPEVPLPATAGSTDAGVVTPPARPASLP